MLILRAFVAFVSIMAAACTAFVLHEDTELEDLVSNDPSVENKERPQIEDTRSSVFNMDPREALKIIDYVRTEKPDCEKLRQTRDMTVLKIQYERTSYKLQAAIAIRTANLVSDMLPTGSAKSLPKQPNTSMLLTNPGILFSIVRSNVESDPLIFGSAVMFASYPKELSGYPDSADNSWYAPYAYRNLDDPFIKVKDHSTSWSTLHEAFVKFMKAKSTGRPFPVRTTYFYPRRNRSSDYPRVSVKHSFADSLDGLWTRPYFECTTSRAWQITYTVPIVGNWTRGGTPSFMGVTTIDIALTNVDINQCDQESGGSFQFGVFAGTHHCKNETTKCVHIPGLGFRAGSYKCVCKPGFYFPLTLTQHKYFNGSKIEAYASENTSKYYTEPGSFECLPCQEGCVTCVDNSPCLVALNWPLRHALLSLGLLTIVVSLAFVAFVMYYREIKVVKTASPQFLCIILSGAILMFLEILVSYPAPDNVLCVVRLWFRHIGFGLAYTSLLLKTWRIAVIFRVKSAQKVRLTDRHLLQRLAPILAVYLVYLLAWTLAAPSHVMEIGDTIGHKFYMCSFDWWDHAIMIFEVMFLFWGIRLCFNVRKAPSAFNESKFISWSIYNMTVVTLFLKIASLFITNVAGPDMLYLIEFFRIEFTVSPLLGMVFIPKIFRVLRGRGDLFDTNGRLSSVKGAALSLRNVNAGAASADATINLGQENEDLKAEIRKLYAQLERMKMTNMEAGNRHLSKSTSMLFNNSTTSLSSIGFNNNGLDVTSEESSREKSYQPPPATPSIIRQDPVCEYV